MIIMINIESIAIILLAVPFIIAGFGILLTYFIDKNDYYSLSIVYKISSYLCICVEVIVIVVLSLINYKGIIIIIIYSFLGYYLYGFSKATLTLVDTENEKIINN